MRDLRVAWRRFDYFRWRGWAPVPLYAGGLWLSEPGSTGAVALAGGVCLTLLGLSLRGLARLEVGRSSDTRRLHCQRLVTTGIYAWTRNPIYLGNLAVASGLALLAGLAGWTLGLMALLVLHYGCVVRVEERHLARSLPAAYARYTRDVARFLPRRAPAAVRARLAPLQREARIWCGVALGIVLLFALRLL